MHRAKYRGVNTDLSKVDGFKIHEGDSGSTQVQVARFSARVNQLTEHLKAIPYSGSGSLPIRPTQTNKHDYQTIRGLQMMLGKRRRLLIYLYKHDRAAFDKCISELKIRFSIEKGIMKR